jgi:nitroimidazol reductase NimA-like FMN-containing flavoprotein (pyridoxamine 5'-phosphate oxidase superfamily)
MTLSPLAPDECWSRLGSSAVGRVGVTSRALPVVVPVNYVVDGRRVVFRTAQDGLLARACADSVVAFEVDQIAPDGRSGWSVLLVGVAHLLDGSEALRATQLNLASAPDGSRDQFVAITPGQVSGRLVPAPGTGDEPPKE